MRYVYDYLRQDCDIYAWWEWGKYTQIFAQNSRRFSASLYDLCKENKQRAEGGPLQELAFSMVTPLSGPRPAWWS